MEIIISPERIKSFFREKYLNFIPLTSCIFIIAIGQYYQRPESMETSITDAWALLAAWFIPAAVILLFVRRAIVAAWMKFAVIYVCASYWYLLSAEDYGYFISERAAGAFALGILIFFITVCWILVQTLLIRRGEGKTTIVSRRPILSMILSFGAIVFVYFVFPMIPVYDGVIGVLDIDDGFLAWMFSAVALLSYVWAGVAFLFSAIFGIKSLLKK